jgi:hypothetical protein
MTEKTPLSEYLVISRGQWDKDLWREEIQNAIDKFYVWHGRLVSEGRMKAGQRPIHHEPAISELAQGVCCRRWRKRFVGGTFTMRAR